MKLNFIKQFAFLSAFLGLSVTNLSASELINGKMIKQQAQGYFHQNNLGLSLVVSDKRTFFPCSSSLEFSQRSTNNWSTVVVTCPTENWSTLVRSRQSTNKIFDENHNVIFEPLKIVTLAKNISKGQVISADDLILLDRPETKFHGAFKQVRK